MPRRLFAAFSLGGLLVLVQPVIVHVIRDVDRTCGNNPQSNGGSRALAANISLFVPADLRTQSHRNMTVVKQLLRAQSPVGPAIVFGSGGQGLPDRVAAMRQAILEAAESGVVEEMREAIELSEMKPEFGPAVDTDPIAYWKQLSSDGEGREVLVALAAILKSGWARRTVSVGGNGRAMYVWPYLAEMPLRELSPAQDADLRRLVPGPEAEAMRRSGRYTHWSLGIAEDGTWHYFVRGQ